MDWLKELEGLDIRLNEPMSRHTSFRVGGMADCLVMVRSERDIGRALRVARENAQPALIVGNGSNLLVRDGGIRGLVIKIDDGMKEVGREGHYLRAQAGISLAALAAFAQQEGLSGLEFAAGIPGNLGGALAMNAGAYGEEIAGIVRRVHALNRAGESLLLGGDDMRFGYRQSRIADEDLIAVTAKVQLRPMPREWIRAKMIQLAARRSATQPLRVASAGSTFKRPEGHYAGKLIEDAGLKGRRIGAAQVSPKHAGFIVNNGGARAKDILELIQTVQRTVYARFQVRLETEVRIIGED